MKKTNIVAMSNTTVHRCYGKTLLIFLMAVLLILIVTGCTKNNDRDSDKDRDARASKATGRGQSETSEDQKDFGDGISGLFGSKDEGVAKKSGDQEGTEGVKGALKSLLNKPGDSEDFPEDNEAAGEINGSQEEQEDTSLIAPPGKTDSSQEYQEGTQINSPIVGTWRSGDESRPTYIGAMDSNVEYVFNEDGTYSQIVIVSINYIYQCTGYIGNYTVSEGEVHITNRSKSTFDIQQYEWQEAHLMAAVSEYEPVEDEALPLIITDNEHILVNSIALYRAE